MSELFLWLGASAHRRDINTTRTEAGGAAREAARAQASVDELRDRLDRLELTCVAMWELICEQTELSESDLMARIRDVDLRDGKLDGKLSPAPVACAACARTNAARRERCLYCGATLPGPGAFGGGG